MAALVRSRASLVMEGGTTRRGGRNAGDEEALSARGSARGSSTHRGEEREHDRDLALPTSAFGEAIRAFQEILFGVFAVMSKQSHKKLRWAVLEAIVVNVQFLLVPIQLLSWNELEIMVEVRQMLLLVMPLRLAYLDYTAYLCIFWGAVALVAASAAAALYVGWAFANQAFSALWPLKFLRFAVSNCIGILYMPLISIFASIYNCPLPTSKSQAHLFFPTRLTCWQDTHITLFIAGSCAAVVFTGFAAIAQLLFFEPDFYRTGPNGEREYFSRPNSRLDALWFANNVMLSVLINLDALPRDLVALIYLGSGAVFIYLSLVIYPFHRLICNMNMTGIVCAFTYMSLLCVLDARFDTLRGLSVAVLAGVVPAYAAGALLSWGRYRLRMCTGKVEDVARLKWPLHVEIASRFVYTAAPGDASAVETADAIYQLGLEKFPASASLLVSYAMFCFSVKGSPVIGFEKLRQALKMSPGPDLRFVIYRRNLEREQAANASDLGDAAKDIIAHIEYTSNMAAAKKAHRAAARALREFWGHLAADDIDLKALERTLARIDLAESRARQHYSALLSRYPRVPRIVRAFGRFHAEVLNDEATAQKLYRTADECEEERAKKLNFFVGAAGDPTLAPAGPPAELTWSMFGAPKQPGTATPPVSSPAPRRGLVSAAASFANAFTRARKPEPPSPSQRYEVPPPASEPTMSIAGALPSGADDPMARIAETLARLQAGAVKAPPPPPPPAPPRRQPGSLRVSVDAGSPAVKILAQSTARTDPGEELEELEEGAGGGGEGEDGVQELRGDEAGAEEAAAAPRPPAESAVDGPRPASGSGPRPASRGAWGAAGREEEGSDDGAGVSRSGASGSSIAAPSLSALHEPASPPLPGAAGGASGDEADGPVFMRIGTPAGGDSAPEADLALAGHGLLDVDLAGPFRGLKGLSPAADSDREEDPKRAAARRRASASASEGGEEDAKARLPRPRKASGAASASSLAILVDLSSKTPAGEELEPLPSAKDAADAERRRVKRWARVKRAVGKMSGGGVHAASIRRMKYVVSVVLVAVVALAICSYAIVASLLEAYMSQVDHVGESGQRRLSAALVALRAQELTLAGQPAWDPDGTLAARARAGMQEAAADLEKRQVHLFQTARVEDDGATTTRAAELADPVGTKAEVLLTLFTAGLRLVASGRRYAESTVSAPAAGSSPAADLYFAKENGAVLLYEAFGDATGDLELTAERKFSIVRGFLIGMFATVTVLLLVLAVCFFRPTVARVRREKLAAIGLFRTIPRAFVRRLAVSRRAAGEARDGSGSEGSDADSDEPLDLEDPLPLALSRRLQRSGSMRRNPPKAAAAGGAAAAASTPRGLMARLQRRARGWRFTGPDTLTLQYGIAFLLLFFLFLAWFVAGYSAALSSETFIGERNQAGLLQAAPVRALFHAREMAASPGDFARQRAFLATALAQLKSAHDALLFGASHSHTAGIVSRYPPIDSLLFSQACIASDDLCASSSSVYREGLEALLLRFASTAAALANAAPGALAPNDPQLRFLGTANEAALQPSLAKLALLFADESRGRLTASLSTLAVIFAAVLVVLAFEYVLVFRRIVANLSDEARRTVFMFLMLPPEVIGASESIREHLTALVSSAAASDL